MDHQAAHTTSECSLDAEHQRRSLRDVVGEVRAEVARPVQSGNTIARQAVEHSPRGPAAADAGPHAFF
jgi:hypothetical protein